MLMNRNMKTISCLSTVSNIYLNVRISDFPVLLEYQEIFFKKKKKEKRITGRETYYEFDDIDGGEGGAKSGDAEIEAASEELLGFFLAPRRQLRIHTCAAVHRYCPTPHLPLPSPPPLSLCVFSPAELWCFFDRMERRSCSYLQASRVRKRVIEFFF